MARETDFITGTTITSAFLNHQQDVQSGEAWNMRLEKASSTVLRVPMPTDAAAGFPSLRINGLPRWLAAAVTLDLTGVATGVQDIYALASTSPATDFTLARVATGGAAPGSPNSRLLGDC